ncbi:hypothetical protein [Symbiobacterium thermophilum]|uniref:Uncharacterized protein n=1 Tax=Symbiobacterium thermophilum TaxID=2734 RepID=A0A1Y2T8K6_SYMTR|nr:hypothetical protein [Symbiobacterium thermophilum]OTA42064.1 MAG: hypothetical protein A6D92_01770 [Symbiobacterium thermophilum]
MTKEKRRAAKTDGDPGRAQQFAGPDHGVPSLVAMDSPDDPKTGAPRDDAGRNRGGTHGRGGR